MFKSILDGSKTFELRKADRPFKVGDKLLLQEYEPDGDNPGYTGNEVMRVITFILSGPAFGLPSGLVILSLKEEESNY